MLTSVLWYNLVLQIQVEKIWIWWRVLSWLSVLNFFPISFLSIPHLQRLCVGNVKPLKSVKIIRRTSVWCVSSGRDHVASWKLLISLVFSCQRCENLVRMLIKHMISHTQGMLQHQIKDLAGEAHTRNAKLFFFHIFHWANRIQNAQSVALPNKHSLNDIQMLLRA